jgi:site-specific recombinase XerC
VTVYGKGGKTRAVLLPAPVWRDLEALREESAADEGPVFRSRKGGPLTARQAQRLVDAAARRAGLRAGVSPHWLRHAHATHALERGAPIHLGQATLGQLPLPPDEAGRLEGQVVGPGVQAAQGREGGGTPTAVRRPVLPTCARV